MSTEIMHDSVARFTHRDRARLKNRGYTFFEFLLVFAAVATIIVGVVGSFMIAGSKSRSEEVYSQVNQIMSDVRSLYNGGVTFGDSGQDLTATAVAAKVFPQRMLDGNTPRNPWGGEVSLTSNGSSFYITYDNVPAESCITLATRTTLAQGTGVIGLRIGSSQMAGQITPAAAAAACDISETMRWEVR